MPASPYPRPGHPIAPSALALLLRNRAPKVDLAYSELNAAAWRRFDETTCKELASSVVAQLMPRRRDIVSLFGSVRIGRAGTRLRLAQLDLEVRTLNCLHRIGIDAAPGGVAALTVGEALEIQGFGVKSLVDLLTSVEAASGGGLQTVDAKRRDECSKLLAAIGKNDAIPDFVLASAVPPLPSGTSIGDLDLHPRTQRALERARIESPAQLARKTAGKLLAFPGFGVGCLRDLLANVRRLRQTADRGGKPLVRDVDQCIAEICAVPGILQVDRTDPRIGRLLRAIGPGIRQVGDLRRSAGRLAVVGRREELAILRQSVLRYTRQTVEMELLELVRGRRASDRDLEMLREYYGLRGRPPVTLASLGDRHGLTRERARQICAPSRITGLARPPFAPALDAALAAVRDLLPAPPARIERFLVQRGRMEAGTTIASLARICRFLGRDQDFEIVGKGDRALAIASARRSQFETIAGVARSHVARFGVATVKGVLERCEHALPDELATAAIRLQKGFRWLDEASGWFWYDNGQNSLLRRRIRKVLAVCGSLDVGELLAAIRRDPRYCRHTPPKGILLELCRQMRNLVVVGERVRAKTRENPARVLSGDEAKLVDILFKHGPICRRELLQKEAAAAGVKSASFWQRLIHCPTIVKYARSVYGLPGAKATPALLDSLATEGDPRRAIQRYGRTDDGRVWIARRMSSSNVATGLIGVPSPTNRLVQGQFRLEDREGRAAGTFVVRGRSGWGLRTFLRRTGAESGDYLQIVFDVPRRTATVSVGDAGLLDGIEDGT